MTVTRILGRAGTQIARSNRARGWSAFDWTAEADGLESMGYVTHAAAVRAAPDRRSHMIPRLSYAVTACALTLTPPPTLRGDELPWNAPHARGPVVFDHPPLNSGGPASDTSFRLDPSPAELWQQLADDILLASPATIRRIVFWGFYGDTFIPVPQPPPITETFRVRFYAARPGG